MLRLDKVSKFYSSNGVVTSGFSKVSLDFHIGEFVAITGESGSGKSTLLNVISGIDTYEEGEMYILGQPTSGFSAQDLEDYRKKYIGNIFQTFNLINSYTVYQNVELVLLLSGYKKNEVKDKVKSIIKKVGLEEYENTKASKLSGGQKQRVAIARALAKETPIIVGDEPTGNLDVKSAEEIIKLLHEISKDKLIIIVTHNFEQVEPYITRKITMYDGHVTGDKRVAEDNVSTNSLDDAEGDTVENVKTAKMGQLTAGNTARLGIRNAFNIPAKFVLMLAVFLFICAGTFMVYSNFQNQANVVNKNSFSEFFNSASSDRIIVTKNDNGAFTDADYKKLAGIENIKHVEKNDLAVDDSCDFSVGADGELYLSNRVMSISDMNNKLAGGRMPKTPNEAVLIFNKDNSFINDSLDKIIDKEITVHDMLSPNQELKLVITGYAYANEKQADMINSISNMKDGIMAFTDEGLNQFVRTSMPSYVTQTYSFHKTVIESMGDNGQYAPLVASDEVEPGYAVIPEEYAAFYPNEYVRGREFTVTNSNKYFSDDYTFKIAGVYTKKNAKKLLGVKDPEAMQEGVYINTDELRKMFDKPAYQASVFIDKTHEAKDTKAAIEKAGYKALYLHEALNDESNIVTRVMNTFRTVMLVIMLMAIFFISYFIIKLIFKSRNVYFSTVRMIGGTRKNSVWLLGIEMFTVFNLAYVICTTVAVLVKTKVVDFGTYLYNLNLFIYGKDFMVLYLILFAMTVLLAIRYASQIFNKSAMNAYKEEV